MKGKNKTNLEPWLAIVRITLLIGGGAFLWFFTAPPAFAITRASLTQPRPGSNLLDQPLKVSGFAPVRSSVFVWIDGKLLGGTAVGRGASAKAKTAAFTFTVRKRIEAGKHILQTQVVKGKEKSVTTSRTFVVPEKWRRKIDGMLVSTKEWNQLPFGVMIENTLAARPQAGLSEAAVVYETVAEGGVTRFLALFPQVTKPKSVGPIRSSRPYYVDWAAEHGAIYLHAGGSRDAFEEIGRLKVRSYDGLTRKGARFMSRKCFGVHCLFTSTTQLQKLVKEAKLADITAPSKSWKFKADAVLRKRPKHAKTLTVNFNSRTYRVDWQYDRATNRYRRWNGGRVATDRNTGRQLTASNVVVIRVPKERVLDRQGRLALNLLGRGTGTLYRDGQAITVTWKKGNASAKTRLYSRSGKEVELNRGTTWMEVVPGDRSVTYQ